MKNSATNHCAIQAIFLTFLIWVSQTVHITIADNDSIFTKTEQLQLLWDHTCLFDETWGRQKNFNQLKRFYKIYATGFAGAAALRNELLGSRGLDQVREILIREGLEFS